MSEPANCAQVGHVFQDGHCTRCAITPRDYLSAEVEAFLAEQPTPEERAKCLEASEWYEGAQLIYLTPPDGPP